VPILKDRTGGTEVVVEKRDEAWRMVPSPPNVATKSVLACMDGRYRGVGCMDMSGEEGIVSDSRSSCGIDVLRKLNQCVRGGLGEIFLDSKDVSGRRWPAEREKVIVLGLCECQYTSTRLRVIHSSTVITGVNPLRKLLDVPD
jgi:hypothetical protein